MCEEDYLRQSKLNRADDINQDKDDEDVAEIWLCQYMGEIRPQMFWPGLDLSLRRGEYFRPIHFRCLLVAADLNRLTFPNSLH